jgi:acyl carrier protein
MPPTLDAVLRLVERQLGRRGVRAEDRIVEDLGAQSLDVVNLVATAEEDWGVEIGEEELADVHTVADLHACLVRHTASPDARRD